MVTTRPTAPSYIIKRPRLTKLLDESEARIILLCAPAGYGKTTLAREWVTGDALWYAVRPTDCDVAAFAAGLAELFTGVSGTPDFDLVDRVRNLAVRGMPAKPLARAITSATARDDVTLVVDDYHHASQSPEADSLLQEITLRCTFRLVLTSRVRPDWVTGRSLVYGSVALIGANELAFTEEETNAALACAPGPRNAELSSVVRGWPAVIGMAALQGWKPDLSRTLGPRTVYDFFAEELFGTAEPLLQESVLKLAAGGNSSMDVARALIGDPFDDVLHAAIAQGFLGHDPERPLTIHPLLREFLLTRLAELGHNRISSIVRPVVRRLNEGQHWDECLTTLKRFPDADLIATTMSAAMEHLLSSGRVTTVRQWVELARSEEIDHPVVLLAEAEIALREGRNSHAQALALRAATSLQSDDAAARAYLTAARAAHLSDDLEAAAKNAARADSVGTDPRVRQEALWLAFISAHEAGSKEARRYLKALSEMSGTDAELALRVACASLLQAHEYGRTGEAIAICERAEALLPHVRNPLQVTGFLNIFAHVTCAGAHYEQALSIVDRLVREAESAGLDFPLSYGLVTRASALVGIRQLLAARRVLGDLDQQPLGAHLVCSAILCTAKLHIAAGDLERAATVLDVDPPFGTNTPTVGEFFGYRGIVAASRGLIDEAETALTKAEELSHYVDAAAAAMLGRAVVALERKDRGATLTAVRALRTVLDTGCREVVVVASRAYAPLVSACAHNDSVARGLTSLFAASRDVTLGRRCGLQMPRETRRRGTLSNREREVYELVAQGRSNRQIAATLFISESTAKVHVRHIFEKLGVRSRVEVAALLANEGVLRER